MVRGWGFSHLHEPFEAHRRVCFPGCADYSFEFRACLDPAHLIEKEFQFKTLMH